MTPDADPADPTHAVDPPDVRGPTEAPGPAGGPPRARAVLVALVLVAAVANLNLAVANVALPDIGTAFDASQTELNLIAVGYSLGLAASVVYLGAVGDRHGRKAMLVGGIVLSVPASLLAAFSTGPEMLVVARLLGGLSAGMAFPTTLALITALWSGAARVRAIALWSAIGGGMAALGPLAAGALLERYWWGSVFLVTLPLAVAALAMALVLVPAHVNETTQPVDHLGGVLSVIGVAALVLGIGFAPEPGLGTVALALAAVALAALAGFVVRQRRVEFPLYDLHVAARPTFWVAAVGGIIVFGSLMGAMFVGQQFLQYVLGYSSLEAGASILPAVVIMVVVAPRSARLVESRGSRTTLLAGYAACLASFVTMLLLWREGTPYWQVALAYAFIGAGVGLAGTPASHSLTSSVPVDRAGMASATSDLQRDLGGALMQAALGALLTAGYARTLSATIEASPEASSITRTTESELLRSYSSAVDTAQRYPQYSDQIVEAARDAFTSGQRWAYAFGALAVAAGAVLVATRYPDREGERRLTGQDA